MQLYLRSFYAEFKTVPKIRLVICQSTCQFCFAGRTKKNCLVVQDFLPVKQAAKEKNLRRKLLIQTQILKFEKGRE